MNKKENLLAVLTGGEPEWVPDYMTDVAFAGGMFEFFENGPLGGGVDGFGITWAPSISAGGQAVPHMTKPLLDDITKWREVVQFPDLEQIDWAAQAAIYLGHVNREDTLVEYQSWNGQFLRLTHLMGFENALCAMYEDPDESYALMEAITDYKIKIVEKAAQYFKPDVFTLFDDVATERDLFMSPETYRKLIKPLHKKLFDAVEANGMMPIIHCCGKCESIIGDFIEEGVVAWTSAQPINDIVGIQKKYGRNIAVIGGYNTNGAPGREDATTEVIDEEVRRCIETYAPYKNFVMCGFRLVNSPDPMAFVAAMIPISEACKKYGANFYKH